jgi:hypothetical protein
MGYDYNWAMTPTLVINRRRGLMVRLYDRARFAFGRFYNDMTVDEVVSPIGARLDIYGRKDSTT